MSTILYRCPNTGLQVQGWIADEPTDDGEDSYQSIACLACRQVHLVNPASGKTAGIGDD